MLRKRLSLLISVLCLWLLVPVSAQDGRYVEWERWDVTIGKIDTTRNEFQVVEEYELYFSGTFRFGEAAIPLERIEEIADIQVEQDGRSMRESCSGQAGTFCVETNNNERLVIYNFFAPVTNARTRISLTYTVYGGLRVYEGGDQLWWTAIPPEHYGFTIREAMVRVSMPQGFAPREGVDPVVTYGTPATVDVRGTEITATADRPLEGDDYLEIRVQYPHDSNAVAPRWQSGFDQQRAFEENVQPFINIGVLLLSLVLLIAVPLWVYTRYLANGRDPQIGPVPAFLEEPPSLLPPALVGTLVDERADLRDVMSTILDLGNRGYLVIEENKTEGLFGISTSSFIFKRTDKSIDDPALRSYERRFLVNLFPNGKMERTLDSVRTVFYTVIAQMQRDLYEELTREGYFKANPEAKRGQWTVLGVVIFVIAGLAFFGFSSVMDTITPLLLCIPAALVVGGVSALIAAPMMPARTQKGAEESAKWKAFVEYLRNLDRYGNVDSAAAQFTHYLPYVVAAGVDRTWINRFKQVETVPIPTWYYPTYLGPYRGGYRSGTPMPTQSTPFGGGMPGELARAGGSGGLDQLSGGLAQGLESISSGLSTMLESAGRAMTSVPQQTSASSGGSGSWRSGGRSWSGGGSRGGGSSGGGRRGFG